MLLATTLVACGEDSPESSSASGLDAVTIEGEVGTALDVTFDSEMSVDELETTTLVTGDGAKVADGDQVFTHIWIGNGFTEKKAFSTYDEKQPELITLDDNLSPVFADALRDQTIGSRVAVTAPAAEAFGEAGNPQLGIGNEDSVLVIVDLISINEVLDGPEGAAQKSPAWAPKLLESAGEITGLKFTGTPQPDGTLRSAALIQGTGDKVETGQTITVNYLGQVYGAKKPFDESYSKGEPVSFGIGTGQVIKGWDETLVGARIGSRMILAIPSKKGYGKQGNEQAGIKGTDTIYFVVDILGAN